MQYVIGDLMFNFENNQHRKQRYIHVGMWDVG